MTLFLAIVCGLCICPSLFVFMILHCMRMQIRSEHDPSHVDDEDDTDSTAHQEVPVTGLVKDAVPSQNLEVTVINSLIYSLYSTVAKESAHTQLKLVSWLCHACGIGIISSGNSN